MVINRGPGEISVHVKVREVGEPYDGFIADFATAKRTPDSFRLLFAKAHPISGRAAALVEVVMARQMFMEGLWPSVRDDFIRDLVRHCDAAYPGWEPDKITDLENAPYHARRASIAAISYTHDEAQIDFQILSTRDFAEAIRGTADSIAVDAVLRVLLSTPLLRQLMVECDLLVKNEPSK